jgi:hypothetical protein
MKGSPQQATRFPHITTLRYLCKNISDNKGTTTSSNAEDAKDAEDDHGEFTSRHGTSAVPVVRGVSFSALFAFSAINAVVVPSAVNGCNLSMCIPGLPTATARTLRTGTGAGPM